MVQGQFQDILILFSEILNFKIRQFKRVDGLWGAIDKESGKWNGMISNLINGDADILVGSVTVCCRRHEVVDFFWMLAFSQYGFFIKSKMTLRLLKNLTFIIFHRSKLRI